MPHLSSPNCHLHWASQTEKELDPEGLRKESEREQAILALTSTLDKLIKRLQESQSPELVQKYKKRRVVPQKPPPSPHPTGESLCFLSLPREHCAVSAPPHTVLPAETPHSQPSGRAGLVSGLLHAHCLVLCLAYRQGLNELSLDAEKLIRKEELYASLAMGGDCRRGDRQFVGFHSGHGGRWTNRQVWGGLSAAGRSLAVSVNRQACWHQPPPARAHLRGPSYISLYSFHGILLEWSREKAFQLPTLYLPFW